MAESTYLIQPRPPVRAYLIAAIAALAGALLVVGALAWGWHVAVLVIGCVLLAAGGALTNAGVPPMGRIALPGGFDDDGDAGPGVGPGGPPARRCCPPGRRSATPSRPPSRRRSARPRPPRA